MRRFLLLALLVAGCGATPPAGPSPAQTPEQVLAEMATQFLTDFSNSDVPVETVMRNFHASCAAPEREDTLLNRATVRNLSVALGVPRVDRFLDRQGCDLSNAKGLACIYVEVEWRSLVIGPPGDPHLGLVSRTAGTDQLTGEYLDGRWWLCSSSWFPRSSEWLPQ